ncbi:dipeptidase [Bordetella genomosp. 7]|uniref:Peptidase M19 n=1 Tax=Bordetella genomosp. 7 TaxID=1416805 RepID=A0A261QWI2_9BORD|nr:membrane dipeptidase [Bordetella genomosp. 7]OZI17094.1 hypothetical protein CAL19_14695 [Bordetella genomosp. 7]
MLFEHITSPLIWDMTLAWNPVFRDDTTLPKLHALGVSVVGLTVGTDRTNTPEVALAAIDEIEALVARDDRFVIIRSVDDVDHARKLGKLGIELNFQGTRPLGGQLELLHMLHARGLRHVGLIWNETNDAGGSSTPPSDPGLTEYGRCLIAGLERVGIIVDGAHAGHRTTLDAIDASTRPFIISHTNCDAVAPSHKNIKDELIIACAATDGVMGISGFGTYLGDPAASTQALFRHIDHIVQLVGPRHAGLGLDYVTKPDLFWQMVAKAPEMWPAADGKGIEPCRFAEHAQLSELSAMMSRHGYDEPAIRGILGENWRRVCAECWQPA